MDPPSTIVCLGDSVTAGVGGAYPYTYYLSSQIPGTTIINKGIGGNKTVDMIARFTTDVVANSPNVCIIEGGINDVGNGISYQTSQANVQRLFQLCISHNIIPVFMLNYCVNVFTYAQNAQLMKINNAIVSLANQYHYPVIDLAGPFQDPSNFGYSYVSYLNTDNLHPSTVGHQAIATLTYNTLFANQTITLMGQIGSFGTLPYGRRIVNSIPVGLSSTIVGGGLKTTNIIEFERITSGISGSGSQVASLSTKKSIASSISGGGSSSANLIEFAQLISSVLAAASETTNIVEYALISSSLSGGGSATSNIIKYNYIISSVVGGGSQSFNPITFERMVSSLTGVGSQTATIIVTTYLPVSFSISGGGSETATIQELEQMISLIGGGGSETSDPIMFERISSVLAATGALTADAQLNTGTVNLSAFLSGNGSEISNIIEFAKTTSTVTGGGLQNAALSSNQIIISSLSGGGTSTANIIKWNYICSLIHI